MCELDVRRSRRRFCLGSWVPTDPDPHAVIHTYGNPVSFNHSSRNADGDSPAISVSNIDAFGDGYAVGSVDHHSNRNPSDILAFSHLRAERTSPELPPRLRRL